MTTTLAQIDPTKSTDHYDLDDGDATHPIYIDYIIPADLRGITKVALSWHLRPFRSTTSVTPSTIGSDATGSSGHSHSHAHTIPISNAGGNSAIQWSGAGNQLASSPGISGNTAAINSDASGESGHSHSHSHSLSGSGAAQVNEWATATITAISFDDRDKTGALGGPWSGDMVELDVTSVFPTSPSYWHSIALSLSGLGRVVSLLTIYWTR